MEQLYPTEILPSSILVKSVKVIERREAFHALTYSASEIMFSASNSFDSSHSRKMVSLHASVSYE